jgi:hypothetical protein
VPFAGASSSFAGAIFEGRCIAHVAVTRAGRGRVEPPMHATSAAMKDASITVTMFGPGVADAERPRPPR